MAFLVMIFYMASFNFISRLQFFSWKRLCSKATLFKKMYKEKDIKDWT